MSSVADIGYGRQFVDFYDRIFPPGEETAAGLARLHPGGGAPSLELGVGNGRVALPLAQRAGPITGVDSSIEMLDGLRDALARDPSPVRGVHGDIRGYDDGRRYGLVYCVCATLSLLLDPADQRQVLRTCSRSLATGGLVVIEVHNLAAIAAWHGGARRRSHVARLDADTSLESQCTLDLDDQSWHLHHVFSQGGRSRFASETVRLTIPKDLDGYAEEAGMCLVSRHGDWRGSPFTGTEPMMVSVYRAREEAQASS